MNAGALLTDLYQLTMAYGYWKSGIDRRDAVFHLLFRSNPFESGFAIAGGLAPAIEYLRDLRFTDDDLAYLATLQLFDHDFLDHLRGLRFDCDVDAIPEGTAVFPQEPLVRVCGPLLQAQLVETALLNIINFQTLIATKAARIRLAAAGDDVIEFGLRRAQGNDGALAASRAAFLGGCVATSNVLAGKTFGIPVRGTHAHSWVMAFETERAAFDAYADAMPDHALLLVDTFDTLDGVRNAIETARKLRASGHELTGVRLDSGDLAALSIDTRRLLDSAGFAKASIVASNDLDEYVIASLKQKGAAVNVWGVGTRLVTGYDQPALGGVYKLGAIRDAEGKWQHKVKISDDIAKSTIPGMLQVRRSEKAQRFSGDTIYDELDRPHFDDHSWDLLEPVFRRGKQVYEVPELAQSRQRAIDQIHHLDLSITRLVKPAVYPITVEKSLSERRTALMAEAV